MNYSEQMLELDLQRADWMLKRQLHCVNDLVRFWLLFGPAITLAPSVECTTELWCKDLKLDPEFG